MNKTKNVTSLKILNDFCPPGERKVILEERRKSLYVKTLKRGLMYPGDPIGVAGNLQLFDDMNT